MKVIAVANQKGGVGKTTTALMLADGLSHCGYNVLFVDLDPQCNSTSTYKAQIEGEYTLYDLMNEKCTTEEAIQSTEMGDILAGDPHLSEEESKFQHKIGGFNIIKKALAKVADKYDYCIMDTPPSLGIYMYNALCAADGVIIPLKADVYSIDGLNLLITTINDVVENTNPNLKIYGALMTAYDVRNGLDCQIWDTLPEVGNNCGFNVIKTPVRICQEIKKAQATKKSLFDNYGSCNGAIDYADVIKELLEVS